MLEIKTIELLPYRLTIHQIHHFLCKNVCRINEKSLFLKKTPDI